MLNKYWNLGAIKSSAKGIQEMCEEILNMRLRNELVKGYVSKMWREANYILKLVEIEFDKMDKELKSEVVCVNYGKQVDKYQKINGEVYCEYCARGEVELKEVGR